MPGIPNRGGQKRRCGKRETLFKRGLEETPPADFLHAAANYHDRQRRKQHIPIAPCRISKKRRHKQSEAAKRGCHENRLGDVWRSDYPAGEIPDAYNLFVAL